MKKRLIGTSLFVAAALGVGGYVTFGDNTDGLAYAPAELALVNEQVEQQTANGERVAMLAWNTERDTQNDETNIEQREPKYDAHSSKEENSVAEEKDELPSRRMLLASANMSSEEPGSHVEFAGGTYAPMALRRSGGPGGSGGGGDYVPSFGGPGMPSPSTRNPGANKNDGSAGPGVPHAGSPKDENKGKDPVNDAPSVPSAPDNNGAPGSADPELPVPAPNTKPHDSPNKGDPAPNPPPGSGDPTPPPPSNNPGNQTPPGPNLPPVVNPPGGPPHVPSQPEGPKGPPSPPEPEPGNPPPPPFVNYPENPPVPPVVPELPHQHEPVSVPEPATLGLLGFGLAALGISRRKKNAKNR